MAPGAVVRLEGLPFRVTKEELVDHLEGCRVYNGTDGVHLIQNKEGRMSGSGYVELESPDDVSYALKQDEQPIGRHSRYAKITECGMDELDFFKNRPNMANEKMYRIRMQGLPFRASEWDIVRWFEPESSCADAEIHINSSGKPSGSGTAFFNSKELAEDAMKMDTKDMDGRYINLTMENRGHALSKEGFFVRMGGLPYRASEQEMMDFFNPVAHCVSVRVILNREGRPSGDAIAEFETEEEADNALKKNREHLGSRFVMLSRDYGGYDNHDDHRGGGGDRRGGGDRYGGRRDWDDRRGGRGGYDDRRGGGRRDNFDDQMDTTSGRYAIRLGGLPFRATEREIVDWFSSDADCASVRIILNREGRPSGEGMAEFDTQDEAERAMRKNKEYLGDRFIILTPQY